ncbi:MAG: response regulator transcription factor [Tetrasphaera sp.]|nr:response regulator transcription factor [Tetrasphaera sp.]
MPSTRVLVVDDEDNISYLVNTALTLAGYQVRTTSTGAGALAEASAFRPDVIVLDVGLPDLDGFEVLVRLRKRGVSAPVLFLTARSATSDRVRGLTAGGDDYIVKPFALEELVARVEVALRRRGSGTRPAQVSVADLVLDEDAHQVWRAGREIHLTTTEFAILRCLMSTVGRVVSRGQLLDRVWQYDFSGESAIVESFISTLRKKVELPDSPRLIHTVRGVGYVIREP